jgi:hypothetical protein
VRRQPRVIFTFGSNLAGIHGAGAARDARVFWDAQAGVGEGHTGEAYALPTCDVPGRRRTLKDIASSIARFRAYAEQHPELTFYVTRIGCGIAGYDDSDIAPLFDGAPSNVQLPKGWRA